MLIWYLCDVVQQEIEPGINGNFPVIEAEYTGINTGATVYHPTLTLALTLVGASSHAAWALDERIRKVAEHDNPGTPLTLAERLGLNAMCADLTLAVEMMEGACRRDVIEAIGQTMDAQFDPSEANVPDIE